jgi:serine protease Do
LSFDGKPVTTSRVLQRMVADAGIDREVEALIWREGKQIRTKIRIGRLEEEKEPKAPPSQLPKATGQVLGLDVAPLDAATRKSFKIDETIEKGVVVIAVRPDSPLKDLDIRVGDIIYDIENKIVATPDDMSARFSELKEKGESSASILISDARGEMRYVRVPLN